MPKHRLAFSKADTAKFISHLDLMRTFQRSFLRRGSPSSTPRASIPTPLSPSLCPCRWLLQRVRGTECQVLDTPLDQVPAKMNAALPAGNHHPALL